MNQLINGSKLENHGLAKVEVNPRHDADYLNLTIEAHPDATVIDCHTDEEAEPIGELSQAEDATLARCEAVIEQHYNQFLQMAVALRTIQREKLYRKTHSTFQAYCQERLGFSRSHGYRYSKAGELIGRLSPTGDTATDVTEHQLREIIARPKQEVDAVVKIINQAGPGPLTKDKLAKASQAVPATKPKARAKAPKILDAEEIKPAGTIGKLAEKVEQAHQLWTKNSADMRIAGLLMELKKGLAALANPANN